LKINYRKVSLSEATEEYLNSLKVSTKVASKMLGMSTTVLKRIDIPHERTKGGHRRISLMTIINITTKLTEATDNRFDTALSEEEKKINNNN
tara:strand:+ start:215 stop:490 length:276 start_codon:yes stop_codon:yes gene_type:complete